MTKSSFAKLVLFAFSILLWISVSSCGQSNTKTPDTEETFPNSLALLAGKITLCDLPSAATEWDRRKIEVHAIFVRGPEYVYLYDPVCRGKKEFEISPGPLNAKSRAVLDQFINPENPEYARTGLVRMQADFIGTLNVGKEAGFGQLSHYLYELEIEDIRNASLVPSNVPYPWE